MIEGAKASLLICDVQFACNPKTTSLSCTSLDDSRIECSYFVLHVDMAVLCYSWILSLTLLKPLSFVVMTRLTLPRPHLA